MRRLNSYDGNGFPGRARRVVDGIRLQTAARAVRDVEVARRGGPALRLRCATPAAYNRAVNAFVNEPGTIRWLHSRLRAGDVFYDVGANIGIFALLAAELVGDRGSVFAFEPHAGTLADLLHNVARSRCGGRISVLSYALNDRAGTLPFHYRSLEAASGLSQLDEVEDPFGRRAVPVSTELKAATTVDALVDDGVVHAAHHVKIDVDGNELAVLRGMRRLLTGPHRPRSLQVEVNPRERDELLGFMEEAGYRLVDRHRTQGTQRLVDAGGDASCLPFNGIFEPTSRGVSDGYE